MIKVNVLLWNVPEHKKIMHSGCSILMISLILYISALFIPNFFNSKEAIVNSYFVHICSHIY